MRWALLLQRVFEIDALHCPHCGSTLRLVAAIEDPPVARKILECLALPARAPPLAPAVATTPDLGQSADDWLFDQSPAPRRGLAPSILGSAIARKPGRSSAAEVPAVPMAYARSPSGAYHGRSASAPIEAPN